MMIRNSLLTLVLFISVFSLRGQELTIPQLSQYLADNPFVMSPTYAGIGDHVKIRLNGLTQWVGIKDAPDTQSLAADMRVGEKSGVGGMKVGIVIGEVLVVGILVGEIYMCGGTGE